MINRDNINFATKYILSEMLDEAGVEFFPCYGYEGRLEISKSGIVRYIPLKHSDHKRKFIKSTPLKDNGYESLIISSPSGKSYEYVHRLVGFTFLMDSYKPGLHINHIDGNKRNNDVSNLEWVTPKQNVHHAIKNNLISRKKPRFNEDTVKEIRGLHKSGIGIRKLAKKYNVSVVTIHNIVHRKTWKLL